MTPKLRDVIQISIHCSYRTHWQAYLANLMTRARMCVCVFSVLGPRSETGNCKSLCTWLALEYRTWFDTFTGNATLFTYRDETRESFCAFVTRRQKRLQFGLSVVRCIFPEVRCELCGFVSCLCMQCTFRAAQFEPSKDIWCH